MQSRFFARRRGFFLAVFGATVTASATGFAAPAPKPGGSGLVMVITAKDQCRVSLVALSYDDPGADDAEFIELRVDGLGADPGPGAGNVAGAPSAAAGNASGAGDASGPACDLPVHASGRDAASSMDATGAVPDGPSPNPPTLHDCGLGELRLVDGGSGACEEYRTIPLADVAIPPDGYVVLCPSGSSVDARAHCDVTTAGRSALRAGWLQNGPNDGLRFVDTGGRTALELGYEGQVSCFAEGAPSLVEESGQQSSDEGVDDVNAVCDGHFVLLPEGDTPLRAAVHCPSSAEAGVVQPAPAVEGGVVPAGADATPGLPERAPARPSPVAPRAPASIPFDGGAVSLGRSGGAFPSPPGCAVGGRKGSDGAVGGRTRPSATALFGFAALARLRRRTRRNLPEPRASRVVRARCAARCGSGPRRSPSR